MANELRVRNPFVAGTLNTALLSTDTTITADCLTQLAAIDSTKHAALTLSDPVGALLARTSYASAASSYTTTAVSAANAVDVDATNLKVTFVAPRSGRVRVVLEALDAGTSGALVCWILRDAGGNVAGTSGVVQSGATGSPLSTQRLAVAVTGLTAGTSYTWKWGFYCGAAGTHTVDATSGSSHPAVMEVWDDATTDAPANSEIVYVTAHTAASNTATIARAQEGTSALAWAAGARVAHGPTLRDVVAGRFAFLNYTGGDYAPTLTTTWAAVDASALDLTLKAQVGDVIEWGLTARISVGTNIVWLDAISISGGSKVTQWATGSAPVDTTFTVGSLFLPASASGTFSVSRSRAVVAGDLQSGQVTLRPYWRSHSSTSTTTLFASATGMPLYLYAKNLGPQAA